MRYKTVSAELARQLRKWRGERRSSQRVLAGFVGLDHSVVARAEKGLDARISTWETLFGALGCRLVITIEEEAGAEECEDYLLHETDRRHWRRVDGLG